jgi:hypothetical protein
MYRTLITFTLMAMSVACGQVNDGFGPHSVMEEDPSKGDNYISTNAREFTLTGTVHATLPEGFAELESDAREDALTQAVTKRMSEVSRSLRNHIDALLRNANGGTLGVKGKYFTFVRNQKGSQSSTHVVSDTQAAFTFEIEMVGSPFLMSKLSPGEATHRTFMIKVTNWADTESEDVAVEIEGSASTDAFPRYDELFKDGVLDLGVHFGGDYNQERHDLETAKWLVKTLLEGNWTNTSVSSFDDLKIDSPPFVRKVDVNGRQLEVRVYVFHSDMVEEAEEDKLSDVMKESLAQRDIVIYSGHAGPKAGFILDYQPKHEIKATEFASLNMADKYQIYILDGCQTYRTYVDDLLTNPSKTFDNLDIVTTVNTTPFSAGYQVLWEFIYWLTLTDNNGNHFPLSWKTILGGVNTRSFKSVHYGVHGIDSNPTLNPYGGEEKACSSCQTDSDCGAGGNLCLNFGDIAVCGVACTHDSACPNGYRCARLTDDPDLFYIPKQCVPRDYICR